MKKIIAFTLALILTFCFLSACSNQPAESVPEPSSEPSESVPEIPETRTFTDSVGRTVEIPYTVKKVAVSGPLSQIIIYSFAPELLVGWSSDWSAEASEYIPEEYLSLPVLGQLYGGKGELNLETLLAADPDVVIDVGEPKDSVVEDLNTLQEQTGIPFVHITATTETTGDAYRKLGELLGLEERAEEYAAYCDKIYSRIVGIAETVGEENKARVLYCLGTEGHNVIAAGSYHAEIIDLLCNNLAVVDEPTSKGSGNEVDMEQILGWNPDVIIFAPESVYSSVGTDQTWQQLDAIKNGKYYEVPFGPYNWMGFPPSVQRYLGMMWLADVLYPDATDYDLKTEVTEYYKMFYHIDLSEEQYGSLIQNSIK